MTGENDPITLADAAAHFGLTVWTLRAEADRGNLTIYRIGRRLYTKPCHVREMIELCRVERKDPASIVTRRAASTPSETARASLDSAQQALLKLRNSSRTTSQTSTAPRQARGR